MIERTIKVRVKYGERPVNYAAIECPNCNSWFSAKDISRKPIFTCEDLQLTEYDCPFCGECFGLNQDKYDMSIQETHSFKEAINGRNESERIWKIWDQKERRNEAE